MRHGHAAASQTSGSAPPTASRAEQFSATAVWFEYLGKVLPVVLPAGARPAAVRQLLCAAFDLDVQAPAAAAASAAAIDGGSAAQELLLRDTRGRVVPVSGLLHRGELYRLERRVDGI